MLTARKDKYGTFNFFDRLSKESPVSFYTNHGYKLHGSIWLPDDYKPGEKRSGVLHSQGYTTVYHVPFYMKMCRSLADAGFVVVAADYRGYGESESPSGAGSKDVTPMEEVEDVMSGISYLQTRPEVSPRSVGLVGTSFGAAVAVYAAAIDRRIAALVANWPIGDGQRWLSSLSRLPEWVSMMGELDEAKISRTLTGKDKMVHYQKYLRLAGGEATAANEWEKNGWIGVDIPSSFIESILAFKPERMVDSIAPRPVLFTHPEADEHVSPDESISLFKKAGDPKEIWIIPREKVPNVLEFEVEFEGSYAKTYNEFISREIDFLKKHLPPP